MNDIIKILRCDGGIMIIHQLNLYRTHCLYIEHFIAWNKKYVNETNQTFCIVLWYLHSSK